MFSKEELKEIKKALDFLIRDSGDEKLIQISNKINQELKK